MITTIQNTSTASKSTEQALEASEGRLRDFVEIAADYFWQADKQDRLTYMSDRFEEITGVPSREVINMTREEVWAIGQATLRWQGIGLSAPPHNRQSYDLEIDWCRPNDGEHRDLLISAIPVLGPRGEFQGYRGIGRDVTAQRNTAREKDVLESRLRQAKKMEAIGQLTGGIAHDFNNIVCIVLGFTELLKGRLGEEADARSKSYLEEIQSAGEWARDLVTQMLAFSRGSKGSAKFVDVDPVVKETVGLLKSILPSSIEIVTKIESNLPPVAIDPIQLQQAMTNLCINARDAMDGHGHIEITVAGESDAEIGCVSCHQSAQGSFLALSIKDTGEGIPADMVNRVFDPFFTTKEVGKGSGLGLSMVHGIVHGSGGHVQLETKVGKGSVFRLIFPIG